MKKYTLSDIAERVGLSTSTVSLVLNDKPIRISDKKRQLIIDTAEKLNYVPNYHARMLASNKTYTIGLVIPDIENPFFSSLSKHIEDHLKEYHYLLFIVNTSDNLSVEMDLINRLIARQVDALFICPSYEAYAAEEAYKDFLRKITIPFILLDRVFEGDEFHSISFDNELGGYLSTHALIQAGATRIACLTGNLSTKSSIDRLLGYRKALEENSLTYAPDLIFEGDFKYKTGYLFAEKYSIDLEVDGIFAFNDLMAMGILKYISQQQLDIHVSGYDNLVYLHMSNKKIPTIDQDLHKISRLATQMIIKLINGQALPPQQVVIEPELV